MHTYVAVSGRCVKHSPETYRDPKRVFRVSNNLPNRFEGRLKYHNYRFAEMPGLQQNRTLCPGADLDGLEVRARVAALALEGGRGGGLLTGLLGGLRRAADSREIEKGFAIPQWDPAA